MCSAAWSFHRGGYELRFNRDERWTRPRSSDPSLEPGGACARDPQGGGTWLFTNRHGLTLALLNAYPNGSVPPPGKVSRGNLPPFAASQPDTAGIRSALQNVHWHDFAPCDLLLLDGETSGHFCWDGVSFTTRAKPPRNFLTTSSISPARVIAARTARFDALSPATGSEILDDDQANDPADAIYVTRADGGTVSRTTVRVDPVEIHFAVQRRGEPSHQIVFPRQ